jgi:hypothetical protein
MTFVALRKFLPSAELMSIAMLKDFLELFKMLVGDEHGDNTTLNGFTIVYRFDITLVSSLH